MYLFFPPSIPNRVLKNYKIIFSPIRARTTRERKKNQLRTRFVRIRIRERAATIKYQKNDGFVRSNRTIGDFYLGYRLLFQFFFPICFGFFLLLSIITGRACDPRPFSRVNCRVSFVFQNGRRVVRVVGGRATIRHFGFTDARGRRRHEGLAVGGFSELINFVRRVLHDRPNARSPPVCIRASVINICLSVSDRLTCSRHRRRRVHANAFFFCSPTRRDTV